MGNIRIFDRSGRFLARVAAEDLLRIVTERHAADGWAIAEGRAFWEPTRAVLARVERRLRSPISGVHLADGVAEEAQHAPRARLG
jgi:hypothetical protein